MVLRYPRVREFRIWSEGYRATGEAAGASMLGTARGRNFREACARFIADNPNYAGLYDAKSNTVWSCRLFPTQRQAIKSFG